MTKVSFSVSQIDESTLEIESSCGYMGDTERLMDCILSYEYPYTLLQNQLNLAITAYLTQQIRKCDNFPVSKVLEHLYCMEDDYYRVVMLDTDGDAYVLPMEFKTRLSAVQASAKLNVFLRKSCKLALDVD